MVVGPVKLRTSIALVAAVLALVVGVEIATRMYVPRNSKIEARTRAEYRDAIAIRAAPGRPTQVLIVGNSLLGQSVTMPDLATGIGPAIEPHRLLVEQTAYLDWYYGVRRLTFEGARPDVFLVVMSFDQWTGNRFRGAYSSRWLLRLSDVPKVAAQLGLGATDTSGLLLSNLSAFYGLREELRKLVVSKLVPDLQNVTSRLVAGAAAERTLPADGGVAIAAARLMALRQHVETVGARLLLVIPPTPAPDPRGLEARIQSAATQSGVTVLVPVEHTLGREFYSDGFHLNEQGEALFTRRLAAALRVALGPRRAGGRRRGSRPGRVPQL